MALADFIEWMDENTSQESVWFIKRLSANDTQATRAHGAGPYIPKDFLFSVFPSLNTTEAKNPDIWFEMRIDSHPDVRQVRAIWYNNRFHGGTRNEARLTNFGGESSPLLDPESTGAAAVLAFHSPVGGPVRCNAWICRDEIEEDLLEDRIGPIEPGQPRTWTVNEQLTLLPAPTRRSCWLEPAEIPPHWLEKFPSGEEIIRKAIELRMHEGLQPDLRLIKRRACEYEVFRSLEEATELPHIKRGFTTIDDFLVKAQAILQRRKSRSGRSLEIHTRSIFMEEGLQEGEHFVHQPETEPGKRPDFVFPSERDYKNPAFPVAKLRMLGVKTTCKDRWRQILNEADRVPVKHLLTLQEGVSEGQFREMTEAGVRLVVPAPLVESYPQQVQPHLQTLESFIGDIRLLRT